MKKYILVIFLVLISTSMIFSAETLSVLMPIGGGYTIEDQEAIAKEFEKENPNVKIEMEFVGWDNLWNKIVTSIGSGSAPDVMYIASRWIPSLVDMGALTPLDKYISEEKKAMYYDSVWDSVQYKDNYWGVVRAMSTKAFIYNKDLFEKHDVEVPTNWEELLEAAKKLHNPKFDVYGIGMAGKRFVSTVTQFLHYLFANDGAIVDSEGNAIINNENGIEALEFYNTLANYAQPGMLEWKREDLIKLFETGRVAMYIDHYHNAKTAREKGINVGLFPIPKGPKGTQPYSTAIVTDCISISAQTDKKELAVEFLNYMTTFEKQKEWDLKLGFVPPMIKEKDLPEFQTELWQPYIKAIEYGKSQSKGVMDWTGTEQAILDAIQQVLLEQGSAQEALDSTAYIINLLQ
ncbi:MAG: sugar ABC transporter substrate-binding protein [Thermotogota bacterium]|nr:sugar ABC transporter substrate-binding protein [Thermotogota bacterium]